MQAQGSVIQGGMMGNFIQIYQNEGTKGLWKASYLVLYPTLEVHLLAELNFISIVVSDNMEKSVANMYIVCHDCFTAGTLVHFDRGVLPDLCSRISHLLKEGRLMEA